VSSKSKHDRMMPIADGFCSNHLNYVAACSDAEIIRAIAQLPLHDLARLARLVKKAAEAEPEKAADAGPARA
jgi:hypothetical protein